MDDEIFNLKNDFLEVKSIVDKIVEIKTAIKVKLGRLKAVGNGETFLSKEQERDIAKNQRIIQKIYKKSYPWVNRPKFRNSE